MSREAPLGLEGVALKEAQGDLGVADVEREEHGSNLSREGPLGHLDVAGPHRREPLACPPQQGAIRADPLGPAGEWRGERPATKPVAACQLAALVVREAV